MKADVKPPSAAPWTSTNWPTRSAKATLSSRIQDGLISPVFVSRDGKEALKGHKLHIDTLPMGEPVSLCALMG